MKNKAEQRKLLRALCNQMRDHLLSQSARWPEHWDGHQLRALVAREADRNLGNVHPDYGKRFAIGSEEAKASRRRNKQFQQDLYDANL